MGSLHRLIVFSLAMPATAFWVLNYGNPVVVDRVDPIASLGQVPSSHVHSVMGGNAFSSNTTTFAQTQGSTCTSCAVTKDLSNYWFPQLYFRFHNGSVAAVPNAGGALIYYLHRIDRREPEHGAGIQPFPPGFRMVAGDPGARGPRNDTAQARLQTRAVSFACLGERPSAATAGLPRSRCPNGLRAQLTFPACWDGRRLDSADHRSHVAYPSGLDNGLCPEGFPKRLMTLFAEVMYAVDTFDAYWGSDEAATEEAASPFVLSQGDDTGYGYHGDFLNGWDEGVLREAIRECDKGVSSVNKCPAFAGLVQPAADMNRCVNKPESGEGMVGGGPLAKLPGSDDG